MIRTAIIVLLLSPCFTAFTQTIDFSASQIALSEKKHFHPKLKIRSSASPIDITHQRIEIKINPNNRYISGRVKTTFKILDESLNKLNLDLNSELVIDGITSSKGQPLNFTQNEDNTFTMNFTPSLSDTSSIWISYSGIPPENGFGSFKQEEHGTGPIIWTLSEPYGALDWWPCWQNLNDKIDSLDFLIEVPNGFQAVSNGLLVDHYQIPQSNSEVFHWRHGYPIATYLVAFAVSNYELHEETISLKNGDLPIMNYLYPQNFENNVRILERDLSPMLKLFDSLFIGYPFIKEKYGHAQFGFGGGMEHQTISFMVNFNYGLMAHELAHHWFGDYITCGSWEDIWLNEGFATYLTGLTYEHIVKNGTWENFLTANIDNITSQNGGSVKVEDTTSVNRIFSSRLSYDKGAMLLHMLRWKLGDSTFYKGVNNYLMDPKLQYSYSKTEDLKYHLENTSGMDLTEFFKDWYEGQGYPSYHIKWNQNGNRININLSQSTSHPSVQFFEMPVPIKLYGQSSDTTIILDHTHNNQLFSIDYPSNVNSIAFDPEKWIVSNDNTIDILSSSEDDAQNNINVFPNPSSDILNVSVENQLITQFIIFNSLGKQITSQKIHQTESYQIPVTNLNNGIYFLQLQLNNKEFIIKKFIKSH